MLIWQYIFIFSFLAVFYNYAGYALILWVLRRFRKPRPVPAAGSHLPSVSFIVAAFNEEDCIAKKIENSLAQDYPADRIEYIFITDGSTDGTMDVIRRYPAIQLMHSPERRGKSAALNRAVLAAQNDILIFSDANTFLNEQATLNITRHYQEARVGGVAGEKKVIAAEAADEVGASEGLYWKYESYLKQLDSDFYSVVGAAGELFSLRRSLYEAVPDTVILDDFIISMRVAQQGFRIVYEPQAYAMELPSFSLEDEQKRKVRIAAGGFQAMTMLKPLFRVWKQPALSFLYISHRVLRWTLSPLCLVLAFISNAALFFFSGHFLYQLLFIGQLLFYGMAVAASIMPARVRVPKLMKLAYYFVFMNVSVIQGFFRFLRGKQSAAWEKARRSEAASTLQ